MYVKLITFTALVASVAGHDVSVGVRDGGSKVYDRNITASPAIWRQVQTVFVNATEGEVIGRISVTDNRPDKNGEVRITEGGVGQKNVTIELKSPTIFRGMDFSVDVYTISEDEYSGNETKTPSLITDVDINDNVTETTEKIAKTAATSATTDVHTNVNDNVTATTETIVEKAANNVTSNYEVHEDQDEEAKVPAIVGKGSTREETHTIEHGRGDGSLETLDASESGRTNEDKKRGMKDGVEAIRGGLRGGKMTR